MQKSTITISAIIPTYNRAHLVGRAIDSVLAQTRPVDEIIVVDDGGSDNTAEIVSRYGGRVRYVRRENGGLAAARNTGVRESTCEWVAFLDDDDEWLPDKTRLQEVALMARPEAILCYASLIWTPLNSPEKTVLPPAPNELSHVMRFRNPFTPCSTVVRKDAFERIGGFTERLRCVEDWEFNARIISGNTLVRVEAPVVRIYEIRNSMSKALMNMLEAELSILETLLSGLNGLSRILWKQRILSLMYYRAAISAREARISAWPWLRRSLLYWPLPNFQPRRFITAALELRRQLWSNQAADIVQVRNDS
jgi:glycosyltransferase involved in cell wall biosynthesis